MKIAIDTSPLVSGHSHRGIGVYTRMLLTALRELGNIDVIESPEPYQTNADAVHYPYFDLFFLTLPFRKRLPTIVTVHDVIPLVLSKDYPPGIRGTIKYHLQKQSLGNVKKIVTDSGCSTADVIKYLKQPKNKVTTVYLAPDPTLQPASAREVEAVKHEYGLQKPYFLYVGDINYNKNLSGLLEACGSLPDTHELVIVSKAFERQNPAAVSLWKIYDKLQLKTKVRVLTNVNQGLAGIYSGAFWYIQPSFYEGFGLPVLEAQACGCPVAASTGGSLTEIVGESGLAFEPSGFGLQSALTAAMEMSAADRDAYINKGFENLRRFSWKQTAEAMVKIYQDCL